MKEVQLEEHTKTSYGESLEGTRSLKSPLLLTSRDSYARYLYLMNQALGGELGLALRAYNSPELLNQSNGPPPLLPTATNSSANQNPHEPIPHRGPESLWAQVVCNLPVAC